MQKKLLVLTGILGLLAVVLGAFGAHALSNLLTQKQQATYQTGIEYHYYHTLALLGTLILSYQYRKPTWLYRAAICFIIGILFFSGSIYLLACKELLSLQNWTAILGPMTPIGGLFFIVGWLMLILQAIQKAPNQSKDVILDS